MFAVTRHVRLAAAEPQTVTAYTGAPWFPSSLVVPPGTYGYAGQGNFVCDKPGLHMMTRYSGAPANNDSGNRLVWDPAWNSDDDKIEELLSGICQRGIVGTTDENLVPAPYTDVSALITKARERPISVRCGYAALFASTILASCGISSRLVQLDTGDTPDSIDDGHIPLEVGIAGKYAFVDVLNDCMYRHPTTGDRLSLAEIIELGVNNCVIDQLAVTDLDKGPGWSSSVPNLSVYYMQRVRGKEPTWRARIFQIPGIRNSVGGIDSYIPEGLEDRTAYLVGIGRTIMTKAAWLAKYYP